MLLGPPYFDADFGLIASAVGELAEGEQDVGPFTLRTPSSRAIAHHASAALR